MTPEQLQTLKAAILADPVLSAYPQSIDGAYDMATYLRGMASPVFTVWNSAMTPEISRAAVVVGATQLDSLTAGKRDALLYIVSGTLDCTKAAVRQALDDLTGSQNVLKAAIVAAEKRPALRIEKILSTGTGSEASPATTAWDGSLGYSDILDARAA